MIEWRIYYVGDKTFDNTQGDLYDAPSRNVLAIVFKDEDHGRLIVSRWDFYYYENGEWFGCDQFGLWDYLTRPGPKKVLFGRTTSNKEYRTVLNACVNDPDFPPKSAWSEGEDRSQIRK